MYFVYCLWVPLLRFLQGTRLYLVESSVPQGDGAAVASFTNIPVSLFYVKWLVRSKRKPRRLAGEEEYHREMEEKTDDVFIVYGVC